jgi:hypothetical protein
MAHGDGLSRRTLFGRTAGLVSTLAFASDSALAAPSSVAGASRLDAAYRVRLDAARAQRDRALAEHEANGDEKELPDYQASPLRTDVSFRDSRVFMNQSPS